jgi:hypothetical protein
VPSWSDPRGAASVEHAALTLLVALVVAGLVAALIGAGPAEDQRQLGAMIARRIFCPVRLPEPCRRDPLVAAYGRPIGALVRTLAPRPGELSGATAAVDFRYCRRPSCAVPRPGAGGRLTTANRRTTAFTEVRDGRRSGHGLKVVYWLYRPGSGWEAVTRLIPSVPAPIGRIPPRSGELLRLVPLETLPGRNHYHFAAGERPPWQWRVSSR